MTKLELAAKLIADDCKDTINRFYSDWEISSWSEMLEAFGCDSQEFKEYNAYEILKIYDNKMSKQGIDLGQWYTDDCEIIEDDGTIYSYRKLTNEVRKQLF